MKLPTEEQEPRLVPQLTGFEPIGCRNGGGGCLLQRCCRVLQSLGQLVAVSLQLFFCRIVRQCPKPLQIRPLLG
eukprot:8798942-Alexandrium_andersonii.AAC.1